MSVSRNHCSSSIGPRVNTLTCFVGVAKLRLGSSYADIGRHGADRGLIHVGIIVDVLDRVGGAQISTFLTGHCKRGISIAFNLRMQEKKSSLQVPGAGAAGATRRMHLHALALLPLHRVIAQLTPATVQTSAN